METEFACCHCGASVAYVHDMGTAHRNHCNACLWSKHLDMAPGDRTSACGGCMEPVGTTLKREGTDKYGKEKFGDVMLVHRCGRCGTININRVAADDPSELVVEIFEKSASLPQEVKDTLAAQNIFLLQKSEQPLILERLFGKSA